MDRQLEIGLSLSLSGEFAAMGRQAEAAVRLFVSDTNAGGGLVIGGERYELTLKCLDDQSRQDKAAELYQLLCCEDRAGLVFGPYSSGLARVAATITEKAGKLLINHGGADDDLHRRGYRLIVSVLTPASEYMSGLVRLLATLKFWRKRVAIVSSRSPFAQAVAGGIERACAERNPRRRGVRVRLKYTGNIESDHVPELIGRALRRNRINVLLSAGSYQHDLAAMRIAASPSFSIPVLGCVGAGVERFRSDLGEDAEGIIGPSQWEEGVETQPLIGPSPREFVRRMHEHCPGGVDYPAAQIYAAGLVTIAAIKRADSLDPEAWRRAFSDLRTSTLFGDFAIDGASGRQTGHRMLLVQWHGGRKTIIEPRESADAGELELPSGWRMILGALRFGLSRGSSDNHTEDGDDPG